MMARLGADDKMHFHTKPRKAGVEAMGPWLVCGTYSTNYLTDGVVPAWYVDSWPKGKQLAQKLIKARFCLVDDDEGSRFLSWHEYQRTKKQVDIDKAKPRERQTAWRQNRNGTAEER